MNMIAVYCSIHGKVFITEDEIEDALDNHDGDYPTTRESAMEVVARAKLEDAFPAMFERDDPFKFNEITFPLLRS